MKNRLRASPHFRVVVSLAIISFSCYSRFHLVVNRSSRLFAKQEKRSSLLFSQQLEERIDGFLPFFKVLCAKANATASARIRTLHADSTFFPPINLILLMHPIWTAIYFLVTCEFTLLGRLVFAFW